MNYDINKPKLVHSKDIIKISDKVSIEIGLYTKRGSSFYDVVLKNNSKEIFLGRFPKMYDTVKAKYNDGKILIFNDRFDEEAKTVKIIKVHSLYDILDDTFLSCTEEEAITMFDSTLDTSGLISSQNMIYRSDIEKVRRF